MNALFTVQMWVLTSINTLSGWSDFNTKMTDFFKNGLGGDGSAAIGTAILVLGFVGAGISFAMHKFNPQSRMPGWISMLLVGLFGSVLTTGMDTIITAFDKVKDLVFSILGI